MIKELFSLMLATLQHGEIFGRFEQRDWEMLVSGHTEWKFGKQMEGNKVEVVQGV